MMKENILLLMETYFKLQRHFCCNFNCSSFGLVTLADNIRLVIADELKDDEMIKFIEAEKEFFAGLAPKGKGKMAEKFWAQHKSS